MRRTPPIAVVIGTMLVVVAMLFLVLSIRARAQSDAQKPPSLSDVQKLQILNAAKDMEIAQLKLEAARAAMQTLVNALTPAGYQINERLELVPVTAKKPNESNGTTP